jgi:protein CpxP
MKRNRDRTARAVVRRGAILALVAVSPFLMTASPQPADARDLPADRLVAQAGQTPKAAEAATPAPETSAQPAQAPTATAAPRQGPTAEVEAKISELRRKLHITPPEEPQFKTYADVMRQNAQTMEALFAQRAKSTDTSAVARLRWYAQLTAAHAEAVSKLVAPFESLYQVLSADQKKAADIFFEQIRQRPAPHRVGGGNHVRSGSCCPSK